MTKNYATTTFLALIASATFLASALAAEPEEAFPVERMRRDWLYQDAGTLKVDEFFTSAESNDAEKILLDKVLEELGDSDAGPFNKNASTNSPRRPETIRAGKNFITTPAKSGAPLAWRILTTRPENTSTRSTSFSATVRRCSR